MATAASSPASNWFHSARRIWSAVAARAFVRGLLILTAFTMLTALMTWPWVIHLRDACADPGDPYLHSWVMWWDFHQTFHDPLHLFNGTIFYPLPYTLAFTENDYGIALLFFPLYAIGLRPLTVNSIATFMGFAFSGYGAFRLTRTLTASNTAAWIGGIVFAFIPYRLHVLSQITYVFSGWMPLLLEALVLFARVRSWKRAAWLFVAFTMNGLSSLTWMSLSLLPLMISALLLITTNTLWRDRDFWVRGATAVLASAVIMFPFLLPYVRVSRLYGFSWGSDIVTRNSPTVRNWLVAESRTALWKGLGDNLNVTGAKLFPGLAAPLIALFALLNPSPSQTFPTGEPDRRVSKIIIALDLAIIIAALFVVGSLWLAGSSTHPWLGRVFAGPTFDRSVMILVLAALARLALIYPRAFRSFTHASRLVESLRRNEAFWIAIIWLVIGFMMSLGMNSWLFRLLFNNVFIFRSMREPSRAAMVASLGLAVLAGIGTATLKSYLRSRQNLARAVVAILVSLILIDLHAAPMRIERGAPDPDQLALWLKTKSIRGGIVELPTGGGILPHLYMLRAADHGKPLINAASTFIPKHATAISDLSQQTSIPPRLLDVMEAVPTSYLIIHNDLIDRVRQPTFELFLARGIATGRLRFIRRLGAADVYALTRTEPEAIAEQTDAPNLTPRDWSTRLKESPENLLGLHLPWSQRLYRLYYVATGNMPRYEEFLASAKRVGSAVFDGEEDQFREREQQFARELIREKLNHLSDDDFFSELLTNSGLNVISNEREHLRSNLKPTTESRAEMLLTFANDSQVTAQHDARSLVLLHYFAYLRRNPDDPPDKDLTGFNYWIREVQKFGGKDLAAAFAQSIERSSRPTN